MLSIGVDLGGTKICTGVLDDEGQLLQTVEVPTLAAEGPDAVIGRIKGTIERVLQTLNKADVVGIGIGSPGPLHPDTGRVLSPPNLPGWDDIPLRDELARAFGLPAFLDNDANAAALAEQAYGAGRGARNMVYITISTGIGAGVILDGKICHGAYGSAGEVGHMIVQAGGPLCTCGNHGCLEVVGSGTAIQRNAEARFSRPVTAQEVSSLAEQGDETAKEVLQTAFRYLGIGIVNIVNVFDPSVVVVGGGVSQIGEPLFESLRNAVKHNHFRRAEDVVEVVPAALGTKAGVVGAALLPRKQANAGGHVSASD